MSAQSKVRPHPYVYDAELSRGSGRRLCHHCGLPGKPGDRRHTPERNSSDADELERRRLGERD